MSGKLKLHGIDFIPGCLQLKKIQVKYGNDETKNSNLRSILF